MVITHTKGFDTNLVPILTIVECKRRDELIMDKMYTLDMLRHTTCHGPSIDSNIEEVHMRYSLNYHALVVLEIRS